LVNQAPAVSLKFMEAINRLTDKLVSFLFIG